MDIEGGNGQVGAWGLSRPRGSYPRLPGRGLWGNVRVSMPCRGAARVNTPTAPKYLTTTQACSCPGYWFRRTCKYYRAYGEAVALVQAQNAVNSPCMPTWQTWWLPSVRVCLIHP